MKNNIFKIEENQCMMLNSFDLNDICVDRRFLICACAYLLTHYTLYLVEIQQTKEKETKREREREREREKWKGRQPNEKKTIEAIQTSVNVHTAPKPIQRICVYKSTRNMKPYCI